ncbi:MAG: HDIG domain-containing metalloprotein, partial [Sphaerochaetaceae bacterium]
TKALFTEDEIGLMQRILGSIIKANVFFDQDLTAAEQQSAISQVSPVVLEINAGDFILRKDTIVTDQQLRVLSYLASGTSSMTFSTGFAIFIFSLACILVTTYLFMMTVRSSLHLFEFLMAFLLGALVVLASSYFLHPLSMQMSLILKQAIFPVILVPVILTMMTNSHASGFCSAALISALLTVLPNIDGLAFFQLLFTACVAVVLVRFLNKRMDSLFLWFFSVLTSVAIAVVAIFFNYTDLPKGTMLSLLVQAANVTVSVILASVLMPVLEDIMNLPTVFKLHELAFTSSPLLARMQTEMPGTYNHCLEVAILSESACAAIGANALLARVGGLYHDIGKLKHPEFFTENHGIEGSQQVNVPDGLAVAIIKSHVRFGLEMGKEHGLPQEILNIIYNHHGNDVVRYYYNEAVNSAMAQDHPVTVNREDFAYPGNPPSTKEEAVVMLADCFEAMSRSQGVDSYQRYIKVFQKLLSSKLEDGQLESCDLSLRELARIGEVFANSLISSRHSRVSYPTVEKKTT